MRCVEKCLGARAGRRVADSYLMYLSTEEVTFQREVGMRHQRLVNGDGLGRDRLFTNVKAGGKVKS